MEDTHYVRYARKEKLYAGETISLLGDVNLYFLHYIQYDTGNDIFPLKHLILMYVLQLFYQALRFIQKGKREGVPYSLYTRF